MRCLRRMLSMRCILLSRGTFKKFGDQEPLRSSAKRISRRAQCIDSASAFGQIRVWAYLQCLQPLQGAKQRVDTLVAKIELGVVVSSHKASLRLSRNFETHVCRRDLRDRSPNPTEHRYSGWIPTRI